MSDLTSDWGMSIHYHQLDRIPTWPFRIQEFKMAKAARQKIKLESTAGTGYFYVTTKPTRSQEKIEIKKYDPKARKHVLFVEKRLR